MTGTTRPWRWSFDRILDTTFAVVLAVFCVVNMYFPDRSTTFDYPAPLLWHAITATIACLSFALRRDFPLVVYLIILIAGTSIAATGHNAGFLPYVGVFALYTVASLKPTGWAVTALLGAYAQMGCLYSLRVPYFENAWVLVTVAWYTLVWAVGLFVRATRIQRDAEHARALEAERTKAIAAAEARVQERLRIARDMHDVVAHTLSVVSVQAGLARTLLTRDPKTAGQAIARTETSAREATIELRRMLGVLREGSDPAELSPAPGVDELMRLGEHDGVRFDVAGDIAALPQGVRVMVFRIVQEGLTNARKHAPGSPVDVTIAAHGGHADVRVVNDLPAEIKGEGEGWGLVGLRERVAIYGGRLDAGRSDGDRFQISVTL